MSTIHEALKKAQKEKDDLEARDQAAPASHAGPRVSLYRKMVILGLLPLLTILLAFAAYSWLHSTDFKALKASDVRQAPSSAASNPVGEAESPESYYQSAKGFQSQGDLDHARNLYQKALRIDPGHVDTLNNLGVIYLQLRDFLAAQSCFEKAIHLRPRFVEAHYNLACLFAQSGESERSLYYLGKAVSLEPLAGKWALLDQDFQDLRGMEDFEKIVSRSGS